MTAKKAASPSAASKPDVRIIKTTKAAPSSSAASSSTTAAPAAAPKSAAPARKKAEDMLFGAQCANLEAAARYGSALTEGAQQFVHEMTQFVDRSLEMSVANLRALMESKDPTAHLRLQAEFAQAAADRLFRQQARLSEIALQTVTDAWAVMIKRAEEALAH